MKKIIIAFVIAILVKQPICEAQITLQLTLDSTAVQPFYCADIGNNDFKYIFFNESANSFSLYNMDMTPYLVNINIPVTDSLINGFTVIYITKSLFDCDSSNIEFAYENDHDLTKSFRVLRTDGTLLLQVDSANGPWLYGGTFAGSYDFRPIQNTSDGTKLFLQKYDVNGQPEILVYALCGTLPNKVYDFSLSASFVKISPSPTSAILNFEINLPGNNQEYQLVIFNSIGQEQKRESISTAHYKYTMDVSYYDSGTYIYSLVSKNKIYQTGKFIINK